MDDLLGTLRRMNMVLVDRKRYAQLLGAEARLDRARIESVLSPYYGALTQTAIDDITGKILGGAP